MILVTGGAGLLGHELITQLLSSGKSVTAIVNKSSIDDFENDLNFKTIRCNLLDVFETAEACEGVTEIYHCAGLVSFSPKDRNLLYKVNAEGTANLVNAALSAGVKKFVHVSSVAALGRIRDGRVINESMQWTPETSNSEYGHSKYLGELEVWRGIAEGLNAVIVNPSIILGAGNWNESSAKIFKTVYDGLPWYTEGRTGFVDVRDTAAAMIMLMESDISAERFIISAENRTYREVFDLIATAFNKRKPYKKVTPFLAAIVWRVQSLTSSFKGTAPLITKETAQTSMTDVKFDNSKLLKAIPAFRYTAIEETITYTCKALQQKFNSH